MKKLYFKESKDVESIQSISITKADIENCEQFITFEDENYEIIEEIPDNGAVYGYVEVSEKENKKAKVKLKDVKASINKKIAVQKKQSDRKILGYIEMEDTENCYIALVKEKICIIPFILIATLLLAGSMLFVLNMDLIKVDTQVEQPVFKQGEKGNGELGTEKIEFGEQPTFRMRLNCTPTAENGSMNLRIESPAEENANYGFVVKVFLIQKVDADRNIIEDYSSEALQIYESPIVYANENIENCPLDVEVESGYYVARAVYDIYDLENNFLGQTAGRLELTVK